MCQCLPMSNVPKTNVRTSTAKRGRGSHSHRRGRRGQRRQNHQRTSDHRQSPPRSG